MALRLYAFAVQALFFKLLKFIQGMIDQYWFQSFFFYIVWSQFQQSLKSVIVTTATGSFENKRAGNSEVALHVFRILSLLVTVLLLVGGGGGEGRGIVIFWFMNPFNGQG